MCDYASVSSRQKRLKDDQRLESKVLTEDFKSHCSTSVGTNGSSPVKHMLG